MSSVEEGGSYAEVAAEQLDELEQSASDDLWNAILDACELALRYPGDAQKYSAALTTSGRDGVFRLPVAGHPPYQVFWAQLPEGPRVEAVFPYE